MQAQNTCCNHSVFHTSELCQNCVTLFHHLVNQSSQFSYTKHCGKILIGLHSMGVLNTGRMHKINNIGNLLLLLLALFMLYVAYVCVVYIFFFLPFMVNKVYQNCDFRQISGYISEMVQYMHIVAI